MSFAPQRHKTASSPSSGFESVGPTALCNNYNNNHRSRSLFSKGLMVWAFFLSYLAASSLLINPVAAQVAETTLTYFDGVGAPLGEQSITLTTCTAITFTTGDPSIVYTSVAASDQHAALNLYQDDFCQVLISSATGKWNNSDPVLNMKGIRWEGTAPATDEPGTLSPTAYPPGMAVQTKVPIPDDDIVFVMDPEKGKIVVSLVSVVLAIGVLIGVYQVYKAAQYKPPPKAVKTPKLGVLGGKKIKKNQAYYKKPTKDDQSLLIISSQDTAQARSTTAVTTTPSNNGHQYNSSANNLPRRDDRRPDVLIDVHDTQSSFSTNFRGPPWQGGGPDLIQFGNDNGSSQNAYRSGPSSSQPAGRSGDV
ncbi:hypothetical protein BGZ65_010990, partial [Modicella reniformis]